MSEYEREVHATISRANETRDAVLAGESPNPHHWLSTEIEIINFEPSPFPGSYDGWEGTRQWVRDFTGPFDEATLEVVEVVERGGFLAAHLRLTGTGRESGAAGVLDFGGLFEIENGACVRITGLLTFDEALQRLEQAA
jgi:hypothetical protein